MPLCRSSIRVLSVVALSASTFAATPLKTTRVATGLANPIFVTAPPGDTSRVFICEQTTGLIKILNLNTGTLNATPFLDVLDLVTGSEQGLLGLAFHPDYAGNGFFYVNYTSSSRGGDTVIARYQVSADPNVATPGSHDVILTFDQPQSNHNGGWIGFGPHDDYLYISTGDGGSGCDPGERAQNLNLLLGKILRIDVDGDAFPADVNADYAIPPDNPFASIAGRDEIFVYGLRNPWRCSFDRVTGDLYIGDVGQDRREEVSLIPAGTSAQNFGWDCMEGIECSNIAPSSCLTSGCTCGSPALTGPIHDYSRLSGSHCAVTGGYVYRGCAIPDLRGTYFFGDYCSATLWSFRYQAGSISPVVNRTAELAPLAGQGDIRLVSSFGEDALGEIYICDRQHGELFRIIANGAIEGPSPHDYDTDGDVDLADLDFLVACLSGPLDTPVDCRCDAFDFGPDGGAESIDLSDFADFQVAFTG